MPINDFSMWPIIAVKSPENTTAPKRPARLVAVVFSGEETHLSMLSSRSRIILEKLWSLVPFSYRDKLAYTDGYPAYEAFFAT